MIHTEFSVDNDGSYYSNSSADDAELEEDILSAARAKPQLLLRYPVPAGQEDESGLVLEVKADWEPVPVKKEKVSFNDTSDSVQQRSKQSALLGQDRADE